MKIAEHSFTLNCPRRDCPATARSWSSVDQSEAEESQRYLGALKSLVATRDDKEIFKTFSTGNKNFSQLSGFTSSIFIAFERINGPIAVRSSSFK